MENFKGNSPTILTFLLVLMPFFGHIYSSILPILYGGQIWIAALVVSLISLLKAFKKGEFTFNYFYFMFIPYSLFLVINEPHFIMYLALIIIFSFCYSLFFSDKRIYKFFVLFLTFHFVISFVISISGLFNYEDWLIVSNSYYVLLHRETFEHNILNELSVLNYYPEILKERFHIHNPFSLVYYLFTYEPTSEISVFGFKRFYGLSDEPGFYACLILPAIFMAIYLRMKKSTIILLFALFMASSYWSFAVLFMLLILFIILKIFKGMKRFLLITIFFLILFLIIYKEFILLDPIMINLMGEFFGVQRTSEYFNLINTRLDKALDNKIKSILYLAPLLTFVFLSKNLVKNQAIYLIFLFSFVFMLNKGSATITPLFLFYVSFLIFIYQDNLALSSKKLENST